MLLRELLPLIQPGTDIVLAEMRDEERYHLGKISYRLTEVLRMRGRFTSRTAKSVIAPYLDREVDHIGLNIVFLDADELWITLTEKEGAPDAQDTV